jgi:hypothetical protein
MKESDFVYLVLKRHHRKTGKILNAHQLRRCLKNAYSTDDIIKGVFKFNDYLDERQKVV